jgi:hypothetical protein
VLSEEGGSVTERIGHGSRGRGIIAKGKSRINSSQSPRPVQSWASPHSTITNALSMTDA